MEITKSHWGVTDDKVNLTLPFSKIDRENRQVSGWATLDNVDQQSDVVLSTASKLAFSRFRGNIREMHEPIAAGRLVDFKEDSFYDPQDKKFYNGIWVTVYVSKGAQSTWEKVLDGTLSGFSIGGNINDAETEFVKDATGGGKSVRFIKDYDLVELSLVDSPCNQLANVFSINKSEGASFMKGMVVETHLLNVFWCGTDEIAKNSPNESEDCLHCGKQMEVIGWLEQGEDVSKVHNMIDNFLRKKEDSNAVIKRDDSTGEGGVEMTDENTNTEGTEGTEEAKDVVTSGEVEVETTDGDAGKPDPGSERVTNDDTVKNDEVDAEPDFEKMFDSLKDSVNKTLESNKEAVEKAVQDVESKVSEINKAFDEKATEFEKSIGELRSSLDGLKTEREEVTKRIDALEEATAIKKSGNVETDPEKQNLRKGLWSGTFFDD